MNIEPIDYRTAAARLLAERPDIREAITRATLAKEDRRREGYADIDSEAWRDWASRLRRHVLANLDHYLEQASRALEAHGIRVHWAEDAQATCATVLSLCREHEVRRVVKGKSMLTEEIELNPALEAAGIEVTETDLGEYLIQLAGERPSHIIGPAYHKPLSESQALFAARLGTPDGAEPTVLAAAARKHLRHRFLAADMMITGANCIAADTGTIALVENEGNIRIGTTTARIHVACVGIEKLVPRLTDLGTLLPLLSRAATGQRLGNYVSLISGPRGAEPEGPDEVHVIFVDNGRSRLLADPPVAATLACIRCGACLNACPVFRQTGGHPYQWAYSGPIGAVLAPGLLGLERGWTLAQTSTLCGACDAACPVRIPLSTLLRLWRERAAQAGLGAPGEAPAIRAYARLARHPRRFHIATRLLGRFAPRFGSLVPPLSRWLRGRTLPRRSRNR